MNDNGNDAVDEILKEIEQNRQRKLHSEENVEIVSEPEFENEYELKPIENSSVTTLSTSFFSWLETVLVSIMTAFVLIAFFLRVTEVVGVSMNPTLEDGDKLFVYQFMYEPQYGDIVAVKAETLPNIITGEMGEYIVKRVIGLEGDVMSLDKETGKILRNGETLDEDYIAEEIDAYHTGNLVNPIVVPKNCVFVLGDNRNNSIDSRFINDSYCNYYVGCIDKEYILGKAILRIWPFDRFGAL